MSKKEQDLSAIVADVKHQFEAVVGKQYHLYRRQDGTHFVSMVEPQYWTHIKLHYLSDVIFTQNNTWEIITEEKGKE